MYKHTLKVWGESLANDQALPQNASADGNGGFGEAKGGAMGGLQAVVEASRTVGLADATRLSVALAHGDDGQNWEDLATVADITAAGAFSAPAGAILGRYVLPTHTKKYIKAVLSSTDPAATGGLDVFFEYLPR